ncbi:MAG: hypothetical protein ACF8Q5_13570 [Phycisphaerales bacterium JB040]
MRRPPSMLACVMGLLGVLAGCQTGWQPSEALVTSTQRGRHHVAREVVLSQMTVNPNDRNLALDRVRLGMVDLADGQVEAAETPFLAAYDLLRTSGVNEGVNERIFFSTEENEKVWKGDPFEIAAAQAYFAAQLASVGDWGSARAAAGESLFQLADFETEIEGEPVVLPGDDTGLPPDGDLGYQPVETNFAPGYFMAGLSSYALGIESGDDRLLDEAGDQFRKAVRYAPELEALTQAILAGNVNTVLWVDYGKGPQKYRTGRNREFSEYRPLQYSGDQSLVVSLNGGGTALAGPTADFNDYATDHRWRHSEGVRVAKAALGEGLVIGGAVAASHSDSDAAVLAGLGAIVVGALFKNSAQADIRHNELLPQRVYFVGLTVEDDRDTVELRVEGNPDTRMVLTALGPEPGTGPTFRYVRLLDGRGPAPAWATSGEVYYANDEYDAPVPGDDLPYVLGGRCVRSPTQAVWDEYVAGGLLPDAMTFNDLKNLYRAEGLTWELGDQGGLSARHVLEGGTSLIAPAGGTAGFARLFGQPHSEYVPRTPELRAVIDSWSMHTAD